MAYGKPNENGILDNHFHILTYTKKSRKIRADFKLYVSEGKRFYFGYEFQIETHCGSRGANAEQESYPDLYALLRAISSAEVAEDIFTTKPEEIEPFRKWLEEIRHNTKEAEDALDAFLALPEPEVSNLTEDRLEQIRAEDEAAEEMAGAIIASDVERERQAEIKTREEREELIAEASRMAGRIEGLTITSKFADVSALLQLKKMKEEKIYRDIPGIGTWEKFCISVGVSSKK